MDDNDNVPWQAKVFFAAAFTIFLIAVPIARPAVLDEPAIFAICLVVLAVMWYAAIRGYRARNAKPKSKSRRRRSRAP
ncbi:MAG: hypothetical protein HY290_10610 [Planctomycetia bacterium]|nr:hypothetical protein [Planctomycetia bacterium]